MKKYKKRGISPLIATVLLIGFTITVAAVLMTWAGDYVKEKAEKEGLKGEAQSECATSVDIKLKNLDCSQSKVTAIIENKGSIDIGHWRVRAGEKTRTIEEAIDKRSQGEITYNIENAESIQIFPLIRKESKGQFLFYTCSDKMIEAKC